MPKIVLRLALHRTYWVVAASFQTQRRWYELTALRRNPTGWLMDGVFRYTAQFEEQPLDEDSGMAGLPGVSKRDP